MKNGEEYFTEEKRLGTKRDLANLLWNCLYAKKVEATLVQKFYNDIYCNQVSFLDWKEYTDSETPSQVISRFRWYHLTMQSEEVTEIVIETKQIYNFCSSTLSQFLLTRQLYVKDNPQLRWPNKRIDLVKPNRTRGLVKLEYSLYAIREESDEEGSDREDEIFLVPERHTEKYRNLNVAVKASQVLPKKDISSE